jgi:hypothetical protein
MTGDTTKRPPWKSWLFPDPERRAPGERLLRTVLRTVHIASMAVLLGGHFFDVPKTDLLGALVWTVASGVLIVLLEVYGTMNWLFQVRGLATVLKVVLVGLVPVFWEQRVWLLMAVLAIGSLSSHATGRIRYYSVLTRRSAEHKPG